jgi:FAD-linked sulfhydryl oxidase
MIKKNWTKIKWAEIHSKGANYPTNPTDDQKDEIKLYIKNMHKNIPCGSCSLETKNYMELHNDKLDEICLNKLNLFNFFVDFHNHVNKKLNKTEMSYEDAYKIFFIN